MKNRDDHLIDMVCPFLVDDPVFARGVEFGLLYASMRNRRKPIRGVFHLDNQEQILLLASRAKWAVAKMEELDDTWFRLILKSEE